MSRRTRSLAVALLLLMLPLAVFARRRKPQPPGPEQIVWRYCQLDLQGARLSDRASGSQEIDSLRTAPLPEDPERFVVTRECALGKVHKSATSARVVVEYSNLGTIDRNGLLEERRKTESVVFRLKKDGRDWKISGRVPLPHVSPQALRAAWEYAAVTGQDAAARERAQNVLDRLRDLQHETPAGPRVDVSSRRPAAADPH